IDKVEISAEGEPTYSVIGKARARGLAGSAVVDVLAELFKAGIVDSRGTFKNLTGRVRKDEFGVTEYVIATGDRTQDRTDITINQKDIREVQLAKAAIRAGAEVLLAKAGVPAEELRVMYVAGAFGFFLNPITASALGLYPEVRLDRVRMVGNTAVTGAKAMLVSAEARRMAEEIAIATTYVELAREPEFRRRFLDSMSIPRAATAARV
ncbi:MAG TPA: ASKHA domain-containing protein, partial [archaeon]|nr:ASKHA domain-containing protein [archaeon]